MQAEIATTADCPNCGGTVSVYFNLDAWHNGLDVVDVVIGRVTLGDHECPLKPCPQCEARDKEARWLLKQK